MSRVIDILDGNIQIYDLIINSENRTNRQLTSSTDFTIEIANVVSQPYLLYSLKSATIPKTFYNIEQPRNTFTIIDSVGQNTVTIPRGNYTMTNLLAELQTQLNALGVDTYTTSFSDITGKITITSSFANFAINPTLATLGGLVLDQLGFNLGTQYNAVAGVIEAPNVADISGIKNIYIVIDEFTQYLRSTTGTFQNFKVQMNGQFGDIIYWTDESGYHQYFDIAKANKSAIKTLHIKLVDQYNQIINLNGREWQFILQIITKQ